MVSVHFEMNIVKDARNWWDCANNSFYGVDLKEYIPSNILLDLQSTSKENAVNKIWDYLEFLYSDLDIQQIIKELQDWRESPNI